jgi:Fe-S-cluster-containing dehydrogenase component
MKKWNLIIDVATCEDCNNCFLACKDEHVDNHWPGVTLAQPRHGHRWINIFRKERGRYPLIDVAYLPTPCMHCDDPPCMQVARNNAVIKRPDGIVILVPERAKGLRELVKACPYGAIYWNEEQQVSQKCTLCAHLLDDGWSQPRCVQSCPTGALSVVYTTDEEMTAMVEALSLEVLYPEINARPRVYYRNLYRYNRCFISGSIAVKKNDVVECAENTKVVLVNETATVDEAVTDGFGDFKFDGLSENSGAYQLEISYPGMATMRLDVVLTNSASLGTILLE